MKRVVIIHWRPSEAAPLLEDLQSHGFDAVALAPEASRGLAPLRPEPPDAFLIDLSRLPSHGKEVARELRRNKRTRAVPLLFYGGAPEKTAAVRAVIPDAVFSSVENLAADLARAIDNPPANPIVPPDLGSSGTPLAQKLGIKAGTVLVLIGAPEGFERKLNPLPEDVDVNAGSAPGERVLLFVDSAAGLERRFAAAARRVKDRGGLWLIWPKRKPGVTSDIDGNFVRDFGLASGWVDYKVCAVDDTWSGLLFARKK